MMDAAPVPVRFMYIGNLEAYQGIDLLLESFAILKRTRPMDRLIIIGGVAGHIADYRKKAQQLGLGGCVEFRGHQSVTRLAEFLGEADVLVSPRIKGTNTPMKIYSYLDSGKPIVATKLLTHTQVLTPAVSVLADPRPDAFAAAMAALAADPARCEQLGRSGREYGRANFSRAAFSKSVDTLYGRVESILHAATHPGQSCAGQPLTRQPKALADRIFDVLVIGAGIHGAATAWAAARRGLRVALIDSGDFGQAASANSMKVMHGGLRYLQHLDFARMRESIRARSALLRFAPHLVAPRSFMMPTFGHGTRSRTLLRAALAANAVISVDRNRGLPPERALAAGQTLSRGACLALLPGLDRPAITGGAVWVDAFADDTERLTWEFVQGAQQAGAVAVNYVRAEGLLRDGARVVGVTATDLLGGGAREVRATMTVYAGGPWLQRLSPPDAQSPRLPSHWVRAYNLVARRPWVSQVGAALEGVTEHHDVDAVLRRGKRNLFFAPWRGGTIVGTWYDLYTGDPDTCGLSAAEIQAAVREVNQIYPAWGLRTDDITMTHVGVMPAGSPSGNEPDKHTRHLDEQHGGPPGLVVLQGVKFTTGVVLGEALAERLVRLCGESASPRVKQPAPTVVKLVRADQVQDWCRGRGADLSAGLAAVLAQRYGPRFCQVLEVALASPEKLTPIGKGILVLAAEVRHAVRYELAVRLTDVVLRRTGLGTLAAPSAAVLEACSRLMAEELGWDAKRQSEEIAAVRAYYAARGVPGP